MAHRTAPRPRHAAARRRRRRLRHLIHHHAPFAVYAAITFGGMGYTLLLTCRATA